MLTIELGYKATSERTGIKQATLRKWAERGHWFQQQTGQDQLVTATVTSVTPPGDILLSELQRHERATKLSLARSAERMSKDAEQASLRHSKEVLNVAKVAAITHQWEGKDRQQANVMVNVALLGIDPKDMQAASAKVVNDECRHLSTPVDAG